MFSQVCVILSTGEMVSGYAWYQVPLGGGWLGIQEGGVQGVGILGVYHGMGVEVGIPRRRVKQGVSGYDLVYPLSSLVLTFSDGQ